MNQSEEGRRPDLFDRIMGLALFRPVEPFYRAHKEGLLYLFFGGVTTLVSFLAFGLFFNVIGWSELVANLLSWVLAVLVAYVTNCLWVFDSAPRTASEALRQLSSFYLSRVATFLVEEGILALFVTWLSFPAWPVKITASIVVVLLNYILSKLLVFRRKTTSQDEEINKM